MPTSCKDAIAKYEAAKGVKAAEAEKVRSTHTSKCLPSGVLFKKHRPTHLPVCLSQVELIALCPPIEKMDSSLNSLKSCKHLALSTNNIDKIGSLSGLENLEILSLGRNCLKKLENLDGIAGTLRELWLSYNQIDRLVRRVASAGSSQQQLQERLAVDTADSCEDTRTSTATSNLPTLQWCCRRGSRSATTCACCTCPTTSSRSGQSWSGYQRCQGWRSCC